MSRLSAFLLVAVAFVAGGFLTPSRANHPGEDDGLLTRMERAEETAKRQAEEFKQLKKENETLAKKIEDTNGGLKQLDLSFVRYDTTENKILAQFGNVALVEPKKDQAGHYIVKFKNPYPDAGGYTVVVTIEQINTSVYVTSRQKDQFLVNATGGAAFNLIIYGPPRAPAGK